MVENKKSSRSPKKTQKVEIVGETKKEKKKPLPPRKAMPKLTFDAWWSRAQRKHKFDKTMKEIVYKHFKARGFLKNGMFDEGIKDFGLKP